MADCCVMGVIALRPTASSSFQSLQHRVGAATRPAGASRSVVCRYRASLFEQSGHGKPGANRYETVVVAAPATPGDGKTETLLIDRQTDKTRMRTTDFDPVTFTAKSTYGVPQQFKVLPPEAGKPFLPPY